MILKIIIVLAFIGCVVLGGVGIYVYMDNHYFLKCSQEKQAIQANNLIITQALLNEITERDEKINGFGEVKNG